MRQRKFLSTDGEVLAEEKYNPTPRHRCFYCETPVQMWNLLPKCAHSLDGRHDWVTVITA